MSVRSRAILVTVLPIAMTLLDNIFVKCKVEVTTPRNDSAIVAISLDVDTLLVTPAAIDIAFVIFLVNTWDIVIGDDDDIPIIFWNVLCVCCNNEIGAVAMFRASDIALEKTRIEPVVITSDMLIVAAAIARVSTALFVMLTAIEMLSETGLAYAVEAVVLDIDIALEMEIVSESALMIAPPAIAAAAAAYPPPAIEFFVVYPNTAMELANHRIYQSPIIK